MTWRCWLFGHIGIREVRGREMFLRCVTCGRRSAGWTVESKQLQFTRPERLRLVKGRRDTEWRRTTTT